MPTILLAAYKQPMRPIGIKIPRYFRTILFSTLALSWCSGLVFYLLNRWITVAGDFGPEKHPWQFPVLQAHGAAAFLMLMCYGAIFTNHAPRAWRVNRYRWLGISLASLIWLQIGSAYILYYFAEQQLRQWIGNLHALIGLCLPLILYFHIRIGRRKP